MSPRSEQEIFAVVRAYAKVIDGEAAIEKAKEQKRAERAADAQNAATNGNGNVPRIGRAKAAQKR